MSLRGANKVSDEAISLFSRGLLLLLSFVLFACASQHTPQTQIITINYSPFIEFQMDEVYACANDLSIVLNVSADSPEIYFQLGEPETLYSFAYQIGEEEIIVVMNNARPPVLNIQQIQELFTGKILNLNQITSEWGKVHPDQSGDVHVWVFSSDNDIQQIFNEFILEGRPVVSSARIAVSPQEMFDAIQSDRSSIGILPSSWNTNHEVFEQLVVASVPILALTEAEPQGAVKNLLGCLQRN